MAARKLIIFEHSSQLGNAPSHVLFDTVQVKRREGVEMPREFAHYKVVVDRGGISPQVTVKEKP
jgi:CRISPR-associated protein Csd2